MYFTADKIFKFLPCLMKTWKGLNYFSEPYGNSQLKSDFYIGYFYSSFRESNMYLVPSKIVFLLGNFK